MREYIENILYDASGLIVGLNESKTSVILGHPKSNDWVVLGEPDFKKFRESYEADKTSAKFDGFGYSLVEKGVMLNQHDNCVFLHRELLNSFGGRWSNNNNRRTR